MRMHTEAGIGAGRSALPSKGWAGRGLGPDETQADTRQAPARLRPLRTKRRLSEGSITTPWMASPTPIVATDKTR